MKQAEAWVDGSYNTRNRLAGYGVYLRIGDEDYEIYGSVTKCGDSSRNILGEVSAAIVAIKRAIFERCSKIVIHYDYLGIEKWATGEWTCRKPISKDYVRELSNLEKSINISFQKVKAHSGDENNNRADRLAKLSCGIK